MRTNVKFKAGQPVLFRGVPDVVKVSSKNFQNQSIKYLLESGAVASEDELEKAKAVPEEGESEELLTLRARYLELYGKEVAVSKKNKPDWIAEKIKEFEANNDPYEAFKAVSALDREGLTNLIADKELELEAEDFDEDAELVTAICEELGVKIPDVE